MKIGVAGIDVVGGVSRKQYLWSSLQVYQQGCDTFNDDNFKQITVTAFDNE